MIQSSLLSQALRLARRELRSGLRGFGVFLTCLFLGVFAISAIGSFSAAARSGLLADASALLGGDLEIRLQQRSLTTEQLAFINQQGLLSSTMEMRTMAAAENGKRALIELKAVDGAYPLYGNILSTPEQSIETALAGAGNNFGALVEESFLQRLEITIGQQVKVGKASFTIRGVLNSEPDRTVRAFHLGPRLLISKAGLSATNLMQPGSLVTYRYRLKLSDRQLAGSLKALLQDKFSGAGWRIQTWQQASPRVRYFLDRMSTNLTLLGLCALLVGGLGVSGAVRGYLNSKTMHIATLKCLGASSQTIFTTYLIQIIILGTFGAGAGLMLGALAPWLIKALAGTSLPIPLQPGLYFAPLLVAGLFGLLIALLFSLKELGIARQIPPAVLFRGYLENLRLSPGKKIWLAIISSALLLAAIAIISSGDKRLALWFILGAALCFLLFRLLASLVIKIIKSIPRVKNPRVQLALANIKRPGTPAIGIIFSLGLGLTALVMIALVQSNLNDMVSENIPKDAPAFFLLDIQPDQVKKLESLLGKTPQLRIDRSPTLRGRITKIAGTPVAEARVSPDVQWAIRGDRFLSYSARIPAGTEISSGQWWPENHRGKPQISLTADLAEGFGVSLGDTLTVNILGRDVTAEISNLRDVDWSTLKLNFAILFSPGVLENAPQTHIAALHLPPGAEEKTYRQVTENFANVSVISTGEVLKNVSRTLGRIGGIFKGIAAIALFTGFLVLAGAVSADQHRRIQDAVIYKVCGATRGDILKTFAAEFILLGLTAGAISALAGSLAALALLKGPLDAPFNLHPEVIAMTLLAGIALTLFFGLLGTWRALGKKPAVFLRNE